MRHVHRHLGSTVAAGITIDSCATHDRPRQSLAQTLQAGYILLCTCPMPRVEFVAYVPEEGVRAVVRADMVKQAHSAEISESSMNSVVPTGHNWDCSRLSRRTAVRHLTPTVSAC